jgi:PTH1 family peptidyl-tRNA hydrolase
MQGANRRFIAGLGNPGDDYRQTRHNAGFMAIDHLAGRYGVSLSKRKFNVQFGLGRIEGISVVLAKPLAYMNRSGTPTRRLADYHNAGIGDLIVVHDDIDIEFGRIKIKEKGGTGGHKGIKSVMDAYGDGGFIRLRIGVGRPESSQDVSNFVLERFKATERNVWDQIIAGASEAVVSLLRLGVHESMNRFNGKWIFD